MVRKAKRKQAKRGTGDKPAPELGRIRARIDEVDAALQELLIERAQLAQRVRLAQRARRVIRARLAQRAL